MNDGVLLFLHGFRGRMKLLLPKRIPDDGQPSVRSKEAAQTVFCHVAKINEKSGENPGKYERNEQFFLTFGLYTSRIKM